MEIFFLIRTTIIDSWTKQKSQTRVIGLVKVEGVFLLKKMSQFRIPRGWGRSQHA